MIETPGTVHERAWGDLAGDDWSAIFAAAAEVAAITVVNDSLWPAVVAKDEVVDRLSAAAVVGVALAGLVTTSWRIRAAPAPSTFFLPISCSSLLLFNPSPKRRWSREREKE